MAKNTLKDVAQEHLSFLKMLFRNRVWASVISTKDIAEDTGFSEATIANILKRDDIDHRYSTVCIACVAVGVDLRAIEANAPKQTHELELTPAQKHFVESFLSERTSSKKLSAKVKKPRKRAKKGA